MTQESNHVQNVGPDPLATAPVPQELLNPLREQAADAAEHTGHLGGPPGLVGWTMFDSPSSEDGTLTVLSPSSTIDSVSTQSLVSIRSKDDREYLGIVVKGPFAEPDGLRADTPIVVTVTALGLNLISRYHGRVQVEVLGQRLDDGAVVPPRHRPLPNSEVYILDEEEVSRVLRTIGDVKIGLAESHEGIEVQVPSDSKATFPRHAGILGTTGGGKSTTVSGLIAQLSRSGAASIILDTEGEYTAICDATTDEQMLRALEARGMEPSGVENTYIYHLVGKDPANPAHRNIRPISLSFSQLSPYAVMEILEVTDAQEERFLRAYDAAKMALERLAIYPVNEEQRARLLDLDEMETGYPRMTLDHIYDMVRFITARVAKDKGDTFLDTTVFHENRGVLDMIHSQMSTPTNVASWRALQGKLGRIKRLGIFDNPKARPPNYQNMLRPGGVYIIDLSDTDSPQVNNLVIAQILRGLQEQQDENYREALKNGTSPTMGMVFIEEAHEFLSAERIRRMPVLFQQVARIARRGRKRWLGMVFITQLPQHLPDEVLGLINNWVLHKINDSNVVNRLRRSIGGIDDSLWSRLPNLAPGQAVVSFTSLSRPMLVSVHPSPCRLLMVD